MAATEPGGRSSMAALLVPALRLGMSCGRLAQSVYWDGGWGRE